MKYSNIITACIFSSIFVACEVKKTDEGEAPEVDVNVEAESGELPEFDVDWADVDVATRTKTVTVPKLIVVQEEKEVEVPYIDVNMPGEGEKEERNIMVEAEITGEMHDIDIKKVYATKNNLIVIAELEPNGKQLQENTVRVADQLVLNAPDDLNIKRYIVGAKPTGEYNNQYTYIQNMSDLKQMVNGAKVIYEG